MGQSGIGNKEAIMKKLDIEKETEHIRTNRLLCAPDYDAINRDFGLLAFNSRENKNGQQPYLSYGDFISALEGKPCMAGIVFSGFHGYALIDRSAADPASVLAQLKSDSELEHLEFHGGKVVAENDPTKKAHDLFGYWIAQLLIDTIGYRRTKFEHLRFSNISSGLYLLPSFSTKKKALDAWSVTLKKSYALEVRKTRFVLEKFPERVRGSQPLFELNKTTGMLVSADRKHLASGTQYWLRSNPYDNRPNAPFADIDDPLSDETRMGILVSLHGLMQRQLEPYMRFEFDPMGPWENVETLPIPDVKKKGARDPFVQKAVAYLGSVSVDSKVSDSRPLVVLTNLLEQAGLSVDAGSESHLIIVNSLDKDTRGSDADPYERKKNHQHITAETLVEASDKARPAIVDKLILETAVKKDICAGRLDFGSDLCISEPYIVGQFVHSKCGSADNTSRTARQLDGLRLLKIHPDGSLAYRRLSPPGLSDHRNEEWLRYQAAFDQINRDDFKKETELNSSQWQGFIENASQEITLILATDFHTMPDPVVWNDVGNNVRKPLPFEWQTIQSIAKVLSKSADSLLREAAAFFATGTAAVCADLKIRSSKLEKKKHLSEWIMRAESNPDELVDKKVLRGILDLRFGANSKVRTAVAALFEKDGILLNVSRSKKDKNTLLAAKFGLRTSRTTIRGRDSVYYFVGWPMRQGINTTIPRASRIRLLWPAGGHAPYFLPLAKTLLTWIRIDESTVLPGAFKYLREYAKTEGDE